MVNEEQWNTTSCCATFCTDTPFRADTQNYLQNLLSFPSLLPTVLTKAFWHQHSCVWMCLVQRIPGALAQSAPAAPGRGIHTSVGEHISSAPGR